MALWLVKERLHGHRQFTSLETPCGCSLRPALGLLPPSAVGTRPWPPAFVLSVAAPGAGCQS